MKIIDKDGIRILYPKYGYLLKNIKTNDMYSGKVFLDSNMSPDDFEEIRDESIDDILINAMEEIENKEKSLTKIGKIVANQIDDDVVALSIQEFYDIWQPEVTYSAGQYITHDDILYKVLISHTSQNGWTPDVSPSLFAKVLAGQNGEILDWVQPDSTNAYMIGDKVIFEGDVYESVIDNNVWSPTAFPNGWKKL